MNEKTILCFGDSNTWGADPAGGIRFDRATRWPCILQQELGKGFRVVEEGLCGRTTVWDDPIEGHKNGLTQLVPIIQSHEPLDLVIIMLGTNDLKNRFSVSALDVANSVWQLVKTARSCAYPPTGQIPEILVICPPPFAPLEPTPFKDMFIGGEEKSHQLASRFAAVSEQRGFRCFNAGDVIESSKIDGIHFEGSEHAKLGGAIAAVVREMF
ncbi:SGNH/GDSL hydrolase family protein [Pontiellaceae bacterium B1224]|nr:SGNH/GDSL hydrolase family protein [Pontiellaceae bacterium B1224]